MRKQTALHLDPVVDVIDNSKMSDFKRCMRYGFFKHILGWKSPYPSIDLVFGASYHEGHEVLGIKGYKKENLHKAQNEHTATISRNIKTMPTNIFIAR